MADRFKFHLLTGENPVEQYNNIETKDPLTFYLLDTGVGYLGEQKMFDASTVLNKTNGIDAENASQDKVVTEKDLVDYVNQVVANVVTFTSDDGTNT